MISLGICAPSRAQQAVVTPTAVISTTATSNRERLVSGQEQSAIFGTFVGSLGVTRGGEQGSLIGEYRLTFNQPLAEFGNEGQDNTSLEQDHSLRVGVSHRLTERLTLELGLEFFFGLQTLKLLVAPADALNDGVGDVGDGLDGASARSLTARNQIMSSETSGALKVAVTERDEASLKLSLGWRRDFATKVLDGQQIEAGDQEQARDTFSTRALLGWGHDFTPMVTGEAQVGTSAAVFGTNDAFSRTFFAGVGARKTFNPSVSGRISLGGALTRSEAQGETGQIEEASLVSATAGASLGIQRPMWLGALGYTRGIVENGAVGDAQATDDLSAELVWLYDPEVMLRGQAFGAASRSAFEVEGQANPVTLTYGAGAGALVNLVDWLNLEVSYTFAGQFNPKDEADVILGANAQDGFLKIHTVLVGFSARTLLTPQGRALNEAQGEAR